MPTNSNISLLRSKKGISQAELAEAIGVSQNAISLWETDKRHPPIKQLIAIADYFDVSIDYLVGRNMQPTAIVSMDIQSPSGCESSMPSDAAELERFVRRIVDQALDERQ